MADVTAVPFEQMDPIYEGIARRVRATLGVTAFGMQAMTLPPEWNGYPLHHHDATVDDANQEEVYISLAGGAALIAGEASVELRPGMMVRVGPAQLRRVLPGPDGVQFVALGGEPGEDVAGVARDRPVRAALAVGGVAVPDRGKRLPARAGAAAAHVGAGRRAPLYGVMVFAVNGDRIAGITGFPRDTELFARLSLSVVPGE